MARAPKEKSEKSADSGRLIGPLQAEIMRIVWEMGPVSVDQVRNELLPDRDPPVSWGTVATVCNRLAERGVLQRDDEHRPILYEATAGVDPFLDENARRDALDFLSLYDIRGIAQFVGAVKANPKWLKVLREHVGSRPGTK